MGMELVKFDEDDVDRKRVIKENVGKEVLLEDEDEGFLFGKIDSLDDPYGYKFLQESKSEKKSFHLMYHDLLDLYTINPTQ